MELLSKPVSIAIVIAGVFGLLIGWLLRGRDATPPLQEKVSSTGIPELRWRHEKLVLMERQQAEKQGRLDAFADAFPGLGSTAETVLGLHSFVLGERLREARQKVGGDLARMIAVRDRLDVILQTEHSGRDSIFACREMAHSRVGILEEVREELRSIGNVVFVIEDEVFSGRIQASESDKALRKELMEIKGRIISLPQGWGAPGNETDWRIRELLARVEGEEIKAVREILLVDGSITASLSGSEGHELTDAIVGMMSSLDKPKPEKTAPVPEIEVELPAEVPIESNSFDNPFLREGLEVAQPEVPEKLEPDIGFRDPVEFDEELTGNRKGFCDLTCNLPVSRVDVESQATDENRSLVLFCSNNAELWGQDIYRGAYSRAREVKDFPDWAHWISIKRIDTQERVFASVRTASLFNGQTSDPVGFNGTNELFYGARHLGIFSASCPNEVETRFTYGGWGFGHRANEIAPEVEQLQAAGWEGREIPADTVFEIVIYEELPELDGQDKILGAGRVGAPSL